MIEKPDTIGSFLGLITTEHKVRYQMRTEKESIIPGVSFQGYFELPGGRVKEKDLCKLLTPEGLLREAIRRTREELGIMVPSDIKIPALYQTVYQNPETHKIDWAFVIPVFPG